MDKVEINQLKHTLNTAIQKLEKLLTSLKALGTRNTRLDVSDIMMLAQVHSITSSIKKLGNLNSALNNCLDECADHFSCPSQFDLPETLPDDTIYALYLLAKRRADRSYYSVDPHSEITNAIGHIISASRWRKPEIITFKDGTRLLNRQITVPKNLPDGAIATDNVAQFCIGMSLTGKHLSVTLLRHLIAKRCVNILEHVIRNNPTLKKTISPENLLFIILTEMPNTDYIIPIIAAIEETFPGTIKTAEDSYGNNSLWFAAKRYGSHSRHPGGYFGSDMMTKVGQYLTSYGCDPDKPFKDGFSWNTIIRVITIIERHEQEETGRLL